MLLESIFTPPSEEENTKEFRDLWLNWGQAFRTVLTSWSLRFWPRRAICPPGTGFKVNFSTYKTLSPSSPLPQPSWCQLQERGFCLCHGTQHWHSCPSPACQLRRRAGFVVKMGICWLSARVLEPGPGGAASAFLCSCFSENETKLLELSA